MNKKSVNAILIIWTFINVVLLVYGIAIRGGVFTRPKVEWRYSKPTDYFFPYTSGNKTFDVYYYTPIEFLFYVGTPILLIFLYRYIKSEQR